MKKLIARLSLVVVALSAATAVAHPITDESEQNAYWPDQSGRGINWEGQVTILFPMVVHKGERHPLALIDESQLNPICDFFGLGTAVSYTLSYAFIYPYQAYSVSDGGEFAGPIAINQVVGSITCRPLFIPGGF